MLRLQLPVSDEVAVLQLPLEQVGVKTLREREPVWSQPLEKPPQLPHPPVVTVPQELPSVSREQPRFSMVVFASQLALAQA